MRLRTYGFALFLALFFSAIPALAHHALQAEFDTTKRVEFTGTLTRFALINPHTRWFFDVKKPDGTIVKWEVSAAGAGPIRQAGLARAFKLGDTYKVLRGGAWTTRRDVIRTSFRNWDLPIRRQIFAGIRCARND